MILNEFDDKSPKIDFEYQAAAEHLKAGLVSDHLIAFEDGRKVGYLKIDRIDPKLFKIECPDIWSYKQEYGGEHLFSDTSVPVGVKPFEELVKALRSGYMERYAGYWAREMKWAANDVETISKIVSEYRTPASQWSEYHDLVVKFFKEWPSKTSDGRRAVKRMKDYYNHAIKPFVAYINTKENRHQGVESDNSRRGIGTALYLAGAKWIKDRGIGAGLYASSLQSDDAQAAWKKFEKQGIVVKDGDRKFIAG